MLAVLSGNPNASAHFDVGGDSVMLGLMTMNSGYSGSSAGGAASSVTNGATWQIDTSAISTSGLKIALINPHSTGNGFSQLDLTIVGPNGTISQSFTSLSSALAYFNDNVLSLGAPGNTLNFQVILTATTNTPGDSFRAQLVLGTGPLSLISAVSRKIHGAAGTFDVALPLSGSPGVECRSTGGNHTLVLTFTNNVVSGSAMVSSGTGNVLGSPVFSGNTMTISLTGVTNVQTITVTASNVTDEFGEQISSTAVSIGVLAADTNASRSVSSADVAQTKSRIGQPLTAANFRSDINANGGINSGDVAQAKSSVGTGLP